MKKVTWIGLHIYFSLCSISDRWNADNDIKDTKQCQNEWKKEQGNNDHDKDNKKNYYVIEDLSSCLNDEHGNILESKINELETIALEYGCWFLCQVVVNFSTKEDAW